MSQSIRTVRVAATTAVTSLYDTQTVDGVALADGDRVLLTAQSAGKDNGIYVVREDDWWYRADDADVDSPVEGGAQVYVAQGTVAGGRWYTLSSPTGAVATGTDAQVWSFSSGTNYTSVSATTTGLQLDAGAYPVGAISLSVNPTHLDTIGIGADTYEFIATGTSTVVSNDAYIAVVIGADAAATQASLMAAIDGTATSPHPTVTLADEVTGAVARGTESVASADLGDGLLGIFPSSTQGDSDAPLPSAPDIALAADLTTTNEWNFSNLNLAGGRVYGTGSRAVVHTSFVVEAQTIASGMAAIGFEFEVGGFTVQVRTSAGACRYTTADTFSSDENTILVTFDGGAAPAIQAGDVISFVVWQ